MTAPNIKALVEDHANAEYDAERKEAYLKRGTALLRQLAKELGLPAKAYSVRACKGGIAVSGECALHTDTLYLQICNDYAGPGPKILYRTCKGRDDYCGGPNNWASIWELEDVPAFAAKLKRFIAPLSTE